MDQHMKATLDEARLGAEEEGVPIGAALVDVEGNLVATGRNRRVQGMTMYSTLMPCHMCAGAIVQFGITKVVVGESENFRDNGLDLMLRHRVEVIDLDFQEAKDLLAEFINRNPSEWYGDIGQDPTKA